MKDLKPTFLSFSHSEMRFLPSSREPLKAGYSGSCIVLSYMYRRPPPRMTWTDTRMRNCFKILLYILSLASCDIDFSLKK